MSTSSSSASSSSSSPAIRSMGPLGFPFKTADPFLFCVYHKDDYPVGEASHMFAPRRGNGADFDSNQPYRMYHGDRFPGFPQHPHRGFETVTLVVQGTCDHTDSLGQSGRYGGDGRAADLQWMTAGAGCVHGENFPLVKVSEPNTLRLFQLWLNLPKKSKFVPASFQMHWAEEMVFIKGDNGAECQVSTGTLGDISASKLPPSNSWAGDANNDVGIFYITLPVKGGRFTLAPAKLGSVVNRMAYVIEGSTSADSGIYADGRLIKGGRAAITLDPTKSCSFENQHATEAAHVLVLQGRPIGEPVAQRGPFVMNEEAEIHQAYRDYQKTQFGGWNWDDDAVVFPRTQGRFAERVVDGRKIREYPPSASATPQAKSDL